MGKGKKRENKHHKTPSQESSRSRPASVEKANPPAKANSLDRSKTTNSAAPIDDSRGKFSKRKIISNWDRYSKGKRSGVHQYVFYYFRHMILDDISSKITEEKLIQRLSQLVEQSGTNVFDML